MMRPDRKLSVDIALIVFFVVGIATVLHFHRKLTGESLQQSMQVIEARIGQKIMDNIQPEAIVDEIVTRRELLDKANVQLELIHAKIDALTLKMEAREEQDE